jgi:hypothetical protein
MQHEARFRDFRRKVALLGEILESKGIRSKELFQRVGITEAEIQFSSAVVTDSMKESYSRYTNGNPVNSQASNPDSRYSHDSNERDSGTEEVHRRLGMLAESEDEEVVSDVDSHEEPPTAMTQSDETLQSHGSRPADK